MDTDKTEPRNTQNIFFRMTGALAVLKIRNPILQLRARTTKIWIAVAERSGDTAFRTTGCFQKRRGASLPTAVQNPWWRRKPRWVYPCPSAVKEKALRLSAFPASPRYNPIV
jgi:hypothetical protein